MITSPFDHQAKELTEHGMDKVRAIHWEQGCFSDDTEYLSPIGWRKISEYPNDGEVAQWHPETGVAEFVTPSEYVVLPCREMIRIKTSKGVDQKVSFEHKMPLLDWRGRPIVDSAQGLFQKLNAKASRRQSIPAGFTMSLPGCGLRYTDKELRVLVAVMADGSFDVGTTTTRCHLYLVKARKKKRLEELLSDAGIEYKTATPKNRPNDTVYHFNAPVRLKHYPRSWWCAMNNKQRDVILDEVFHWDGSKGHVFYSKQKSDVDFIQLLIASSGGVARINENSRGIWYLEQRQVHTKSYSVGSENFSVEETVDGKKYCFCVPTGFLILRRNGCVFPSGNTGKTWLALATAEALFKAGEIDALFVLAPPGLHTNWVNYEIPDHFSLPYSAIAFQTKRAKTQKHKRACDAVMNATDFPILAMSYPGIKTEIGKKLAKKFLTTHRCLYVADESNRIKTPSAKITRTVLASAEYADYKRTLCGTPITNTPFDVYTQFRFLDKRFWSETPYGLGSYQCFKTMFGIWVKGYNGQMDREFDQLVGYKNLGILTELVQLMSSRVLKEDVLDLPPQLYSYAGFEMTPKQWRLYKELEDDFMAEIDGEMVFTPLAITRLLRLQQVACGYLPTGIENECIMIEKENPRLRILNEITQDLPHKTIIWARFIQDIDLICEMLGDSAVRWDGSVHEDQREENKRRFKQESVDDVKFMVATPDSMGEGHTLNEALTMIYYSNSFKMKERHQSQARNHRAGQTNQVNIIDIVADNTKDVDIINALRVKFDNASMVVDGRIRKWLSSYQEVTGPDSGPSVKEAITDALGLLGV